MNERIRELARQSGATDEQGSRAESVFCFTKQELDSFAELIIKECCQKLYVEDVFDIYRDFGMVCEPEFSPMPKDADLFDLEQWKTLTESCAIMPHDGSGYWATETQESNWPVFTMDRPEWATHVVWYNK